MSVSETDQPENMTGAIPTVRVPTEGRITSLDGLRGIAAVVVVLWHSFLLATPYLTGTTAFAGGFYWLMTRTPLKAIIAGDEAVAVFFVLSGFALALPVLEKASFRWRSYYPSRIVRLYVPAWASIIFAGLMLYVPPRSTPQGGAKDWLARTNWEFIDGSKVGIILREATLWGGGAHFPLNSPLWSLSWEVGFSLLLPVFIFFAIKLRQRRWMPFVTIAVLVLSTTWGKAHSSEAATFLPLFGLGVMLAANRHRVLNRVDLFMAGRNERLWSVIALVVSIAVLITWHITTMVWPHHHTINLLLHGVYGLGALGLVTAVYALNPLRSMLGTRVPIFLGRISFSLYLTHVPLLVTFAYLFGTHLWAWGILVSWIVMVPVAYLFMRGVERPSHRLAKLVSRSIDGRWPSRTR